MPVTIDYAELQGSPTEDWSGGGFTATRQLQVAWANRHELAKELLEGSGQKYGVSVGGIELPARAHRIGIQPVPAKQLGEAEVAAYEFAQLSVQYALPDGGSMGSGSGSDTSRPISESFEPSMMYLTLDFEDFVWAADIPIKEEEAPGKPMPGGHYVFTQHVVFGLPIELLTLMGKVNQGTVYAPTLGLYFAPETLLYMSPAMSRRLMPDATEAWRVTISFSLNATGWNKFWRQETGAFSSLYTNNGANLYRNHELADFSPLGVTISV